MTFPVLSWQVGIWQSLMQQQQQNCLPHAFLFTGIEGVGKKQFAEIFAQALLCEATTKPCGECRSCQLFKANSHPDFKLLEPEETSSVIKIEQVRQIVKFVSETAFLGEYRVILIHPASALNAYAANALLKTLEEPTPKTIFILLCQQNLHLPATIISRCQQITFPKPTDAVALAWLRATWGDASLPPEQAELSLALHLAEGGPFKAKAFLTSDMLKLRHDLYHGLVQLADPLQLASQWHEKQFAAILNLLLIWIRDLVRAKYTSEITEVVNQDQYENLHKLTQKIATPALMHYLTEAQQAYGRSLSAPNLNRQLVLETLFIRWSQLCA